MRTKQTSDTNRLSRWCIRLGASLGVLLGLHLGAAAQKPKTQDFYGEWYLNFKYAEITPKGAVETDLFNYDKRVIDEAGDYKLYEHYEPVKLVFHKGGDAELHYKRVLELKGVSGNKTIEHHISVYRSILPLGWWLSSKTLSFSLRKAKRKSPDQKYEHNSHAEHQTLVAGKLGSQVMRQHGEEAYFRTDVLEHLVENLDKMQIENYSPKAFVLNGRNTFKPLNSAWQKNNTFLGWHSNVIYVTREMPEPEHGSYEAPTTNEEEQKLQEAGNNLAQAMMKFIAPMSGSKPRASIWGIRPVSNADGRQIRASVALRWEARHLMAGVSYGTCEVLGELVLFPPLRSMDNWRATFTMQSKNDQAARVSSPSDWKEWESSKTIDL